MKTYEELLSDIEEDMELMGASHIVYSAEENGVITDYDYLPSDLCMTSTTLIELQEKLHEQMLYDKASAYTSLLHNPSCKKTRLSDSNCVLWHAPGKHQG